MRQCLSDKVIKFHGSGLKNDGVLVSYVKVWVIFHPGSTAKVKNPKHLDQQIDVYVTVELPIAGNFKFPQGKVQFEFTAGQLQIGLSPRGISNSPWGKLQLEAVL